MNQWQRVLLWLAVLLVVSGLLSRSIRVDTDLSLFVPEASDARAALLVDELRAGSSSKILALAIEGDEPDVVTAISRELAKALHDSEHFVRLENGLRRQDEAGLQLLRQYRYLLSPEIDAAHFSSDSLRDALNERLYDLASSAEVLFDDLLSTDPTAQTLAILDTWTPDQLPDTHNGVWYSETSQRALLMAETRAAGFDLDAQQAALRALRHTFDQLMQDKQDNRARLLVTGPGAFGVEIRETTRAEAQFFSILASVAVALLLLLAYRSPSLILLCGLPLVSGLLVGLLAVQLIWSGIHGITLAFGVTLLGVAVDYPIHLVSHVSAGHAPAQAARSIWPTLRLGLLSTVIAYATLVFTGFEGLAQLGVLTCAGLITAALATRYLLPTMLPDGLADPAAAVWVKSLNNYLHQGHPWIAAVVLIAALAWLLLAPGPLWNNDLSALSPVARDSITLDQHLRNEMGAPEVRYVLAVRGGDADTALQKAEALRPALDQLVKDALINDYDMAAIYLPSQHSQRQRQAQLPDRQTLQTALDEARQGLPFRADLFAAFVDDVQNSRQLPLLTRTSISDTPLALRVNALLRPASQGWVAWVPLSGLQEPVDMQQWTEQQRDDDLLFMDLKRDAEQLVAGFRSTLLSVLALAMILITVLMLAGLRSLRRILAVLLPLLATLLLLPALFNLLDIRLGLFHLVAIMLVGGLVLDYALFLNREEDSTQARRSLHAVCICGLSTLSVFGILSLSDIPVLRALGSAVALGIVSGFVLAAISATRPSADE